MSETKTKTITMKGYLVDRVNLMAKKENRNFSNMVETILIKANEENEELKAHLTAFIKLAENRKWHLERNQYGAKVVGAKKYISSI